MALTSTAFLFTIGLFETLCFHVDEANYWYMKGGHIYHQDRGSKALNRKALDGKVGLLATLWEYDVDG